MTITDLCQEIKNWFDVSRHIGEFEIENGTIDLDFLSEGQFFRIIGSVFNDGIHQYPNYDLQDEKFNGAIWVLTIPPAVLDLAERINEWETKNRKIIDSPFQSESFGGYAYSKKGGSDEFVNWQKQFRNELNRWRKI